MIYCTKTSPSPKTLLEEKGSKTQYDYNEELRNIIKNHIYP